MIVDDEPPARAKIRSFLERESDIEVVAECDDGTAAVEAIREHAPDVLFLDVEMPGLDGLEVVEAVGSMAMPLTVFVTAFDRYAVKAFEKHAVDYLLKPFDRGRFQSMLAQVRERLQSAPDRELDRRLETLLAGLRGQPAYASRLTVKSPRGLTLVRASEVDWVDAAGNYVRLNSNGATYLMRETMSSLERRLDPRQFMRIHRSTIVNIERIREIRPLQHGEHLVVLDSGQRLTLSRSYRNKLDELSR